jgi:hypothetical protein
MANPHADVVICTHRHDPDLERENWSIKALMPIWREMGLRVEVQRGPARLTRSRASVAVNHVSLTVTPPSYLRYLRRFPTVINGALTDISKSRYCEVLSPAAGYEGAVLVKTNLNYGGGGELHSLRQRRMARGLERWRTRFRKLVAGPRSFWSDAVYLNSHDYPIFAHPSLVPADAWSNPNLVIQKFQPEMDRAGLYRLRWWYVLGDRGFHALVTANQPVVKGTNIVSRQVTSYATPPALERLRKAMRMDYGRVDYVMIDDEPVVFDINRTPISSPDTVRAYAAQWRDLAQGIRAFQD